MKQIIGTLVYDTNNATLIDTYYHSNFEIIGYDSISNKLYITKNNRFFLHIIERSFLLIFDNKKEYIKNLTNQEAFDYMKKYCPNKITEYFNVTEA